MNVKRIVSLVISFCIVVSVMNFLSVSADNIQQNTVYASALGTGDGSKITTPMAFDDAVNTVSDGGTVYILGKIGTEEDVYNIGNKDKAISFVGADGTAEFHSGKIFNLSGKVSFSNLKFTVNVQSDLGFKCESTRVNDITFGEGIIFPDKWTNNGHMAFLMNDGQNKMKINSGSFTRIYAGGYNGNLSNVNSDITINSGSIGTYAIAHGYSAAGWNGSIIWSGNYKFTVNGGTVDNVILGHASGGLRTLNGTATVTVNGGTVNTVVLSALNKDRNSSGIRIAEINGGNVGTVKMGEEPINKNFKTVAIFNNNTAESVSGISGIDTVIKAGEGGKVSAVTKNNALSGYKIETENRVLIDGKAASPDSVTGLYSIGTGTHTVEFEPMMLYASENGKYNGFSPEKPATFKNAVNKICDGGTVCILDKAGTPDDCFSLESAGKHINIVGYNQNVKLYAGRYFSLSGNLTFSNITFAVNNVSDSGFVFAQSANNDITFGENVVFPSVWKNDYGRIFPTVNNSTNKITVKSGNLTTINAAQYNVNAENVNTSVVIDGGNVGTLAVAHGWSPDGWNASIKWSGSFDFTVNSGKADNIVLGHIQGGLRTVDGIVRAVINGGSVGTVTLNSVNRDLNSSGMRIAEINGGTVNTVKCGTEPINKNFKSVLILNNGMSEKIENLNISGIDTVIRSYDGGTVHAELNGSTFSGYRIVTDKTVSIDGVITYPNVTTGLYAISNGVHTVEFLSDTYADSVRRKTWVERAESIINTPNTEFTAGLDNFKLMLAKLKTYEPNEDENAIITDFKIAWNKLKYKVSGKTVNSFLYDYGDVNADGVTDLTDFVRSKKYVSGQNVMIAEFTLDMNDDKVVNSDDLILLRKMLFRTTGKVKLNTNIKEIIPEPDEAYKLNPMSGGADTEALEMRNRILNSKDSIKVSGKTYYISPDGKDSNDGLSENRPLKTLGNSLNSRLKAGDAVLLKRGGIFRLGGSYSCVNGVTYGAYGTGNKPAVYGSLTNYANPDYWEETCVKNVWKIKYKFSSDVGIIVFNQGEHCSERMNNVCSLKKNGDFLTDLTGGCLYLYCDKGNPGSKYYSIEIGTRTILFNLPSYNADKITIDNICFKYSGSFAIRASINSKNITVTNCEIGWIGGALQPDEKNVYGNGIELIGGTQNSVIKNCWIYQIFDSAVTFQGYHSYTQYDMCYKNIEIENNLMEYCGMSAVEWWAKTGDPDGTVDDTVFNNISISGNIMRFTGYGWVKNAVRGARTIQGPWAVYTYPNFTDFCINDNIFDISLGAVYSFPFYTEPKGHRMYNNTYYQKPNSQNPQFPNIAIRYGDLYYAVNQSEFETAISVMEKNPKKVVWMSW